MIITQAKPVDYEKAIALAKGKVPDKPVVQLGKYNLRKIWDNYEIIADVPMDDTHFIRIASGTLDGYRYISFREFYYHRTDAVYKPGKNGIRVPMFAPFYIEDKPVPEIKNIGDDFASSVLVAIERAKDMPLVDKANSMYISTHYNKHTAVKAKEKSNNENL